MGIGKSTFYRYIKELKASGIVSEIEDGIKISTELFPICRRGKESIESFKKTLDQEAELNPSYKYNKVYKEFYRHYDTGFKDLHMDMKDFPDALISGVYFLSSKKEKEQGPLLTEFPF